MYYSVVGIQPRPKGAPPIVPAGTWLAPLAFLAITACTSTPVAVCPAVVPYTQGEQTRAADELGTLAKPSMLGQMMADYGQLRERLRACQ